MAPSPPDGDVVHERRDGDVVHERRERADRMYFIMSGTVSPDYPALARRVCDLCAVRDTEGCAATAALAAASGPSGEPAVIMRLHLCVQSGGAQGANERGSPSFEMQNIFNMQAEDSADL